ncbi:hypothetical protein Tsubulata_010953 [Turnera subulata]|uniref:Uncharacterized protein n=1 Tax=Turnera subulata TaxID=218843 RepID=A0A9Q0F709_9ROSI|nr:hypothetical protein Tsubulata_010953 [Turnera subulata]
MSNPKSVVDSSLWWDPFTSLLTDLENAPLSSDLPPHLVKKLRENHSWFVDTVSLFKPPNQKSKEALNSPELKIGSHNLIVTPELKDKALHISSYLCLDEVQSYILVQRSLENNDLAVDSGVGDDVDVVLLQYYIERQCLLKCTRRILMHAVYLGIGTEEEDFVRKGARKLISDGLESKLISVLHDLLSSTHPVQMDVDLFTLWAEETLIEDNLVLDILFLIYYESLCSCNGETWRKLCLIYKGILSGSLNFGKLTISTEAIKSSYHAKVQLLLILIETLDLEKLLQLVHDEIPYRQAASSFSVTDIQEMDALVSSINNFEMKETGPLLLSWAVFLCLVSSFPGKEENDVLMEVDHAGYVRQAFEGSSLRCFVNILDSDILRESDGHIAGYRSVLRTFISAFVASYEINLQSDDTTLNLILDILCKIYRGEESLCMQFWDRESFIDGPIRCLLCNLEGEFPLRSAELVRLLSSLCEGSWPAECVYNFLDKSVGISSLFEITSEALVENNPEIVETRSPLLVPGLESLLIPAGTRGHVLKVLNGNTALVRWEYVQSGVLVLLLRLAHELYLESNEEVFLTLDLFRRMVSFNTAVTFSLLDVGYKFYQQEARMVGHMEKTFWVVETLCTVIKRLPSSAFSAVIMSMGISILAKMLKCAPSHVAAIALKTNVFEMALNANVLADYDCSPSGSWLLSGRLAKLLLVDSEQNDYGHPLTISVLDFTMQLVETRLENDLVLALVVFSMQYILVNHEYWKYKVRNVRWKVTVKVLELMDACIKSVSSMEKLGKAIRDVLLNDSSIHNVLLRLICTTKQTLENLYVSRLFDLSEIEGFQLAICSALDILHGMLSHFSEDMSPHISVFHQVVMSSTTKPTPVVAAVMSLTSYTRNPAIQVRAARVLSVLLTTADSLQPYFAGRICFGLDEMQIADLGHSVEDVFCKPLDGNEDLFVAVVNLLASLARYQPAYLVAVFLPKEDGAVHGSEKSGNEASGLLEGSKKSMPVDALLQYVENSNDFMNSNPRILLVILDFLKALWQGAGHYMSILESLKSSGKFWKQLSNCISLVDCSEASTVAKVTERDSHNLAYKYQCQSHILELMTHDMFLKKKLLHAESLLNGVSNSKESAENAASKEISKSLNDSESTDMFSSLCKRPILENMIKSYASCEYNNGIFHAAKVAAALFVVHVMGKLAASNAGTLSVSLVQRIRITYEQLTAQLSFSELLAQYLQRGYSEGKELKDLIVNDLYYHLQGELEGRKIGPGPFKELSQYLLEMDSLQSYRYKYSGELCTISKDVLLYDLKCIQSDLGLDTWDYNDWKMSKPIAKTMLDCMEQANSMALLENSKLSALKALIGVLAMYRDSFQKGEGAPVERKATSALAIPSQLCFSCINHLCQCLHTTIESLATGLDVSNEILDSLTAQAELVLHLMNSVQNRLSSSVCVHIMKTSGYGLKMLSDLRFSISGVKRATEISLMVLLLGMEFSQTSDQESEDFAEISNICLGLLPILCNFVTTVEHSSLSLTTTDLILRRFLTPDTWFPIIQKHLQLQHVILKLQDKDSLSLVSVTFKFLLTLAHVRGGAQMLLNAGFFYYLRVLFSDLTEDGPSSVIIDDNASLRSADRTEKPQNIWGLGLAVIAAMLHSLGDSSSCAAIMENVIPYIFSEKASLILYYLSAPDFPSDKQDKKRPRAQRTQTSLTGLKDTEHTLMLICMLAKHWSSWVKAMKNVDVQLGERSVHLLAFISRGLHRIGESPSKAPLLCPPNLKEEFEWCQKPSILNSRNGWFALSPHCCLSPLKFSTVSATSTAVVIRSPSNGTANTVSPTFFSDLVALQIYKIAFLLLKFLCLEAKGAAKRSEDVGYVDPAYFPELPMPEILHGLQDQAVAIVLELCEANNLKQVEPEIQSVCVLLLQIMEMALYLELCVLRTCGIRPVSGRVEDFGKEVKLLFRAMEGHAFLKAWAKSLKQITSLIYPGLLQSEGFS